MATITDKVMLFPSLGLALGKTLVGAATGPFRGKDGAPTYSEHVRNTFMRNFLMATSIEQLQWLSPTFVDTYKSWCTKQQIQPDVVDIPNTKPEVQGFWIGSKSTAKYTLVYYHGGGFAFPGAIMHVDLLFNIVKWSNQNIAVFCVTYSLSLNADYPVAIGQSVEGLRYILDLPGHSPETTLLGGDSAGGNLVLAVLSHVSGHPHPQQQIVKPLNLQKPLKGAIMVAPWVSSADRPSSAKYFYRDYVNSVLANYWIEAYKGRGKQIPDDEYICAVLAKPEWWKDTKCGPMLVTAGEHEVLVDSITEWVDNFRKGAGNDRVKYVVGEREVHDAPLTALGEARLNELGERCQEGAIRLWVKQNFA